MRVAFLVNDIREPFKDYGAPLPYFNPGVEALLEGVAAFSDIEIHMVSCTQQPVRSPEKLAEKVWYHNLHVPKIGWLRTGYQGCIRAVRHKLKELKPDIAHAYGTERDCAISAIFSGFPNVVTIQGNIAELARINRPSIGSYLWLAARLENFTLPRAGGVICNSLYTERLVHSRAKRTWLIYPGLRGLFLQPPTHAGPRDCALMIAGVISPRKRQLELLDVAEALHRRGLKFEFRFVGYLPKPNEPYARSFLEKIKPMEKTGYARYLGAPSHSDMVRCFDSAAGMVHFPTEEAFGSVVAEGFARDLKFFGARTGGIVEIADGAPGAELFETNDWSGLTDAIARWIKEGHFSPTGSAALMRERYHPEIVARRHLEIYREFLRA